MRWVFGFVAPLISACSLGNQDTGECQSGVGTLTVVLMGSWGAPYENATDIRIVPQGGEGFLVSMTGTEVQVELAPGDYAVSMDKLWMLDLGGCGGPRSRLQEEQVSLEIDCAFKS